MRIMSIDTNSHTSGLQASAPAFGRPQVSPPQPLGIKGNWADNWKIWKHGWDNYCIIASLNSQLEDYKCTILLYGIGIEAMWIYNGMKYSTAKYVQHFCGQTQEFFELFQFSLEIKLLVSQLMSIFQFCETWLKLVVSVTACEIC